jgi:hypothetical protein
VKIVTFQEQNRVYVKNKAYDLETESKNKNITDLYRGINDFKNGNQPRLNIVKDEKVIWLQTPTVFWQGGGIISLNY